MTNQLRSFFFASLIGLLFAFPGCDCSGTTGTTSVACESEEDCADGQQCVDGFCQGGADDNDFNGIDDKDVGDDLDGDGNGSDVEDAGDTEDDADDDAGEDPVVDPCPDAPTCEDLGAQCGSHPDGCGGFVHCGSCGEGFICGTDDDRGQCLAAECSPLTDCSGTNFVCGSIPDGCGGTVSCGTCDAGSYCGTGDDLGTCLPLSACTPRTCEDAGVQCGRVPDGCGSFLNCGTCPSGEGCDAGQCVVPTCQPKTCAELGAQCGQQPDGCGGLTENCGTCPAEQACGVGPDAGQCVVPSCEPMTCADHNANCGTLPDGCGGTISCGGCTEPEICGGSGIANVCGAENTGPCQGELCEHQRYCTGGAATTVTGTVYAPNGTLPLPNAVVYVPGVPLNQLPGIDAGTAICQRCEDEDLGDPIAGAVTNSDGTFELKHVPAGIDFPLVIKVGKWRRVVTVPAVDACQEHPLPPELTSLPTSMSAARPHDNIPKIAVTTGSVDAMECVFYKLGVEESEFTLPPLAGAPNNNFGGAIHLYRSNGGIHADISHTCPNGNCHSSCTDRSRNCNNSTLKNYLSYQLYEDVNRLHSYDMVVSDCEASAQSRTTANKTKMRDYLNAGGRLFASHFSHDWLVSNGDLQDVFNNASGSNYNESPARVDTTHQRGQTFWNWLNVVNATYKANPEEVYVYMPRGRVGSVNPNLGTQWVYMPNSTGYNPRNTVQQFTFDTPVYPSANAPQCGRVAYSAFHVASTTTGAQVSTNGKVFPSYCTSGDLSSQEKILAYLLFDLGACISDTGEPPPPVCHPRTCADVGATCGWISDGCGDDLINCGTCPDGQMCGGGGTPNVCAEPCTELSCADHGADCGVVPDGCGGSLNCGDCDGNEQCGGDGTPNICACVPLTCDDHGAQCGEVTDGCGGTLDCGTCPDGQLCGGGGIANRCDSDCTPLSCDDHGAQCGSMPDGCGGTLECGSCDAPESCGGGGEANICGCTPLTCDDHGAQCGEVSDGCGGTLECGGCDGDMICEEHQCVAPPCRPAGEECTRSSQCCSRICGAGVCVVN